jgi:hypothetical protein
VVPPTERTMSSVPGQVQLAAIGNGSNIIARTDSDSWMQRFESDPINESQKLIQLEIDASTREKRYTVGPPISILWISRDYSGMVHGHAGECPWP